MKVCVWTEKLLGMETRFSSADLAGEASCGAPWLPTGETISKTWKEREEKDWDQGGPCKWAKVTTLSRELRQSQACRSSAARSSGPQGWAPLGYCHRAELLLGTGSVLGEVQQASFTPHLCQVILLPLSCRGVSVLVQGWFGWSVNGKVVTNKVAGK